MSRPLSGLYSPEPRERVLVDMVARASERLRGASEAELVALLEDCVYHERRRTRTNGAVPGEQPLLQAAASSVVRGDRTERLDAALELVRVFADEIHGRFDPRAYKVATRALPRALTALLSQRRGGDWTDLMPDNRLRVEGDTSLVRQLAKEATLILAPTHVSNLDSPMIGLALYLSDLPPFVYGAGLNLFSNPIMGWWMDRLGAYTVDRKKKARLYKDTLKDYSIRSLTAHHHSLFFPGGTRSRSGAIETQVKKGLLGTGISAWQEMLRAGREDAEVYIVPVTLSFQLVLEANTLIQDHLADAGKQRYIIDDDEFTQPRRLASFASRVLDLDASVVVRFGQPLDCIGNPVPAELASRRAAAASRRRYVADRDGTVEPDPQRDRVYTERLAEAIVREYPRSAQVMVTHLVADACWTSMERAIQSRDPYRILRSPIERRQLDEDDLLRLIGQRMSAVEAGARDGRWHAALPDTAEAVLGEAIERFSRYHRRRAVARRGDRIAIEDPQLCLYYRNRLLFTHDDAAVA